MNKKDRRKKPENDRNIQVNRIRNASLSEKSNIDIKQQAERFAKDYLRSIEGQSTENESVETVLSAFLVTFPAALRACITRKGQYNRTTRAKLHPQRTRYRYRDETTIEIILTKGMVSLIDADDIRLAENHFWSVMQKERNKPFYAVRRSGNNRNSLHREVLGITDPQINVRHKSKNTLDNRKKNLIVDDKTTVLNEDATNTMKHIYRRGEKFIVRYYNDEGKPRDALAQSIEEAFAKRNQLQSEGRLSQKKRDKTTEALKRRIAANEVKTNNG